MPVEDLLVGFGAAEVLGHLGGVDQKQEGEVIRRPRVS
jgi:hypothetical protein